MKLLSHSERLLVGIAFLLGQAVVGCATSSDLKELDAGLSQKMEAMNSSVQAEANGLRKELQAAQDAEADRHAELVRTLNELQSDTRTTAQRVTEGEAQRSKLLKDLRDQAEKSTDELARIVALTTDLRREIRNVEQVFARTLRGAYQAEEAALRERLRVLDLIEKELETLAPEGGVVTDTGSPRAAAGP